MATPFLPPSAPELVGYFVRLNDQDGYRQRLLDFFQSMDYPQVVCLRHDGDASDPHSHFHFTVKTTVKPQAFRVRMKTAFPEGKGNGHMSIKPWDGSHDANSYMFHEPVEHLVCCKGYEDGYLSFLRAQCARVLIEVDKAKAKAAYHLIDLTVESVRADKLDHSDRTIARRMLELAFTADKHIPTKFQLRSYLQKVQWKLAGGDLTFQSNLIESILDDYLD